MGKRADSLARTVTELFEDMESQAKTLLYKSLFEKYQSSMIDWEAFHRNKLPFVKQQLAKIADKHLPKIKNALTKAVVLNSKGDIDISKEIASLSQGRILPVEVPKIIFEQVDYFKRLAEETTYRMMGNFASDYIQTISRVKAVNLVNKKQNKTLYESIKQATQEGIERQPKVVTKSGKSMTYKTYTEMNVRTALQRQSTELQEKVANKTGVCFWLCSSHPDCADDHKDYQGKYYYNENWRDFIKTDLRHKVEDVIARKQMKSFQWATQWDGGKQPGPALTTRPNCRHKLMPVSVYQVLNLSESELLHDLNLTKGDYDKQAYDASQEQRYNERTIRKYKEMKDLHEEALKIVKTPEEKADLLKTIGRDNMFIRKWQAKNKALVDRYEDVLFRDYDRESNKKVIQDLGVRYDLKLESSLAY